MKSDFKNKRKFAIRVLVALDFLAAIISWMFFWFYRQKLLPSIDPATYPQSLDFSSRDYLISFLIIPSFWIFLYYLSGTYFDLYRKSRLHELYRSIISSFIGCLLIGIVAFANDVNKFSYFFEVTSWYFIMHISVLASFRLAWLYKIKRDLLKGRVGYNTLIIGGPKKVTEVFNEVNNNSVILGNIFKGYISLSAISENDKEEYPNDLMFLGSIEKVEKIIKEQHIEEVIIALNSSSHQQLENILIKLSYSPVIIKIIPDLYDIISGFVRVRSVFVPLLISVNAELLPDWQKVCKRVLDVFASSLAILLLSPLYLLAIIRVKSSSPGPIFYRQPRIGLYGKPFFIYKFRSMYVGSEKDGPKLSSDHDPRITPWGRIMRKWRIDEIPQFYNILKGDMSLVGPRPERQFFINKIIQTHPHYQFLHRVKPGLTSWGMVKYGYAENIDQMIQRMRYDLLYIQNCSLAMDVKIVIYTVIVLFQGRGK